MSNAATYTAYVSPAEGSVEVTITRDIPAGICGPWGSFTMDSADTAAIAHELGERGFSLSSDWNIRVNYEGLLLTAGLALAA